MSKFKDIEEAKELLKANGYFVDNLWRVEDVQSRFECGDEEAQEILYSALTNETTEEQIWFSIKEFGEIKNLTEVG